MTKYNTYRLYNHKKGVFFMEYVKSDRTAAESRKSMYILRIAVTAAVVFLLCRYTVTGGFMPAAAALMSIAISENRINFYLLPVTAVSFATMYMAGIDIWPDAAACLICCLVFMALPGISFTLLQKMIIVCAVTVTCSLACSLLLNIFYRINVYYIGADILALCALCISFKTIYDAGRGKKIPEDILSACMVCAAAVLVSGIQWEPAVFTGCYLVIIYSGYTGGIKEGITAGAICSAVTVLGGRAGLSAAALYMFAGIVSGLVRGKSRIVIPAALPAAVYILSMVSGYDFPYAAVYSPAAASVIFALVPGRVLSAFSRRLDMLYGKKRGEQRSRDKNACALLHKTADRLRHINIDSKSALAYGFQGAAEIMDKIAGEIGSDAAQSLDMGRSFRYRTGSAVYSAGGGSCGDSNRIKILSDGRLLIVLSDGMGKGREASEESSMTADSLAGLIDTGFSPETAIKMMNSIISRKKDRFPTVDLCLLEKKGVARIYKMGAASTIIKRGGKVYAVHMSALPLGISSGVAIEYSGIRLRAGDQLMIMSDGITCADRDDIEMKWIKQAVLEIQSKDPQTVADLMISRATQKYGIHEKDDMTVISVMCEI